MSLFCKCVAKISRTKPLQTRNYMCSWWIFLASGVPECHCFRFSSTFCVCTLPRTHVRYFQPGFSSKASSLQVHGGSSLRWRRQHARLRLQQRIAGIRSAVRYVKGLSSWYLAAAAYVGDCGSSASRRVVFPLKCFHFLYRVLGKNDRLVKSPFTILNKLMIECPLQVT